MSVSYAYSSVSTVPAHPLLNDFDLNLLELSPYPCDSCHLDCDNKWENFQQAESSQLSEARYSAHVQDCRSGDKNAQTHLPGAEHDDKSTDTIDGAKKRGDDEVLSRHNGSGCHLKTGDSQNLSRALEQEPESSEDHPLASTRRWHPKSEVRPPVSGIVIWQLTDRFSHFAPVSKTPKSHSHVPRRNQRGNQRVLPEKTTSARIQTSSGEPS
ncbi:hypothetical protein JOL62DRAFT_381638 [Phyllosticta paracitricarpa]|uniref:Uncharacterized protein n=2 Tax=Phyllosticta TaxID=121621 RepID=A0ABR1MGD7_9PEZI